SVRRTARTIGGLALLAAYAAAAAARRRPRRMSLEERLAQFPRRKLPLKAPVIIRWNDHQIPFIEAEHDSDLAVALGLVHAHLRLGQMSMMRRIARGRLAEALGPAALEFDHVLRVLDLGRVTGETVESLPADSRSWLESFASGINAYIAQIRDRPPELAFLGTTVEPWSIEDLIAVGRLASADFTWSVWIGLLKLRNRSDWDELWQRLAGETPLPVPSLAGGRLDHPLQALTGFSRWGSNSLAVAAGKSASGSAIIANDPHLSVVMPNLWLIAGVKSPGYHAVGLMVPAVPVLAEGRNPWIAWGGTNMHAVSSELFDVTDLPEAEIDKREETIRVRWGGDRRIVINETAYGPIISDAPLLRTPRDRRLALYWLGHRISDETSAMLALNRARSWDEFMTALDGLAIPALNMIYADRDGRVGQALAAWLPKRPPQLPPDFIAEMSDIRHWQELVTARDLPHSLDPPQGFVASANDRPPPAEVFIGHFFSPDNRIARLREVLEAADAVTVADLARLQQDVRLPAVLALRDVLLSLAEENGDGTTASPLIAALKEWDGEYAAQSAGALAFELLAYHLVAELHGRHSLDLYLATWDPWAVLRQDLAGLDKENLQRKLPRALARAERGFRRYGTWGNAHRMRLEHPLSALPVGGGRFRFADFPSGGSNETVMKTAHGFSGGRHRVKFGANARHISDLGDPDANWFVLLGGQDGWIGSANFIDQLELWRSGRHIRVPLMPETVRREFRHVTELSPG
ncbi:MAG TPA: penicillin acylase family protein, partial [Afifellaceae bacterium]|nr:penicillin acylase family protein [Afifellaceae bacterium]